MERAESLVSAAAAFSPEQTLARIVAMKDRRARYQMLGALMQSWLLRDPEAAMTALAEAGVRGLDRQSVLRRALNGMAESHPTESFELLTKHPEIAGEGLYRDIFARWGQGRSAPEAMAAINGLTSHAWRREAIGGLAESLGERDLEAALKWAKDLGNPAERDHALRQALEQNLNRDPQRVAAEWGQIQGDVAKTEMAEQLARSWSRRDPDAALEWANRALTGQARERAVGQIAETWMRRDPQRAAPLLETLPPGDRRNELYGQLGRTLAMDDVNAAWKWADTLQGGARESAYREMSRQWADHDPRAAADQALRQLNDPQLQTRVLADIGAQWARHDPISAAQWAANLPGDAGQEAIKGAIQSWARQDPAAAQAYALAMPEGAAKTDIARQMLEHQLEQGVAASARWLNEWEGTAVQPEMTRDVAYRWLREDSMRASQWMGSLPAGPSRDAAVSALVRTIGREDPEAAMSWVRTVSDPAMRASMQERLTRR